VQQTIFFSAGLVEGSTEQDTAKQLIKFFQSPEVVETIRQTGLDPVAAR
jgi:molybdate transport system substrate-binding protein